MTLYNSKPTQVEAVQYGPEFHAGLVKDVAEFIAGRSIKDHEVVGYVRPHGPWDPPDPEFSVIELRAGVDGAQGWVPVPLGHFVVRSPGVMNDHWPVDPKYFRNKYEPA